MDCTSDHLRIRCDGGPECAGFRLAGILLTYGTILLRQAGVYPIEIYSEERIREFDKADRLTASERRKLKALKR